MAEQCCICEAVARTLMTVSGSQCTACPPGKYKSQLGVRPGCDLCPSNTCPTTVAAVNSDTCQSCPHASGTMSPAGSTCDSTQHLKMEDALYQAVLLLSPPHPCAQLCNMSCSITHTETVNSDNTRPQHTPTSDAHTRCLKKISIPILYKQSTTKEFLPPGLVGDNTSL